MVIGDIHGNVDRYLKLLARRPGEPSVQLGDFGIGFPETDRFLRYQTMLGSFVETMTIRTLLDLMRTTSATTAVGRSTGSGSSIFRALGRLISGVDRKT